ncbi:anthranilate phosphoribosyltransferase [Pontibacter diazotrophicus]|uniref:Anthranilate phosphoribosyltransferase n=1 Tax=Pontibacter diazotrophicus TaxID=1400979 RepID=A0A3D8LIN8_9BACT|nr:anthranilate phosphoribosyltransferase [Pontibacter diazotrophicus]RDV16752.1 anthranilate phosphoribosyltransferase [Pontibacter diazotrophicus]
MKANYTLQDNPLVDGIKIIGIGKHGSKPLPESLLHKIAEYLKAEDYVVPIQKGAFYGALLAKGPTQMEQELLLPSDGDVAAFDVRQLYDTLCADSPTEMREIGVKLLQKETLSEAEAEKLGHYIFSDFPGETFRGMAASMMRIRYETDEEYLGLLNAVVATYTPGFQEPIAIPETTIQLAEPFDGVEHSYMITPLLAKALQEAGYRVVVTMGRSAGPKLALNTLDLYKGLDSTLIQNTKELKGDTPQFGWALDQRALSPALDKWVDRRRTIFKRPFLATLEKVLNPFQADILITSVFHITYMQKMVTLADMAGFRGVIVLKRGLEGTLAPSLAKASGILCAARQPDGAFVTETFEADDERFSSFRAEADDKVEPLQLEENLQLIRQYAAQGYTANEDFNKRVGLAVALFSTGLEWLQEKMHVR